MGRPEAPLDPKAGPVQRFALELRKLRREAGGITYRTLAQRTRYTVSTLSRAASGEQLPSLAVTLAYVRACGEDEEAWKDRWRRAEEEAALAQAAGTDDSASPYQGLARFEPGDRERFFGRDGPVAELLDLVRGGRIAAVVGASGSGKSSLLRAGLIPALRNSPSPNGTSARTETSPAARTEGRAAQTETRAAPTEARAAQTETRATHTEAPAVRAEAPAARPAAIRIFTPGAHPARTHHGLFVPAESDGDSVLVVDQFEETFTLCTDPGERTAFIDLLLAAGEPRSRLRVVIAVRADFFGRCAEHRGLLDALRGATLLLGPMRPAELREAIVRPAAAAGLIVERALTSRLLDEVADEPGGLPLLSHVLLETWRRRKGRALTEAAYDAAGGLHGAIARTAEDAYARLPPRHAEFARRVLLRLITPGEGAQDTRRPVGRAELDSLAPSEGLDHVLERLARARLIILDEESVDLAHEALITAWPRLRAWVEEDREWLGVHRRLAEAATAWEELGRDPGALYRGSRLAVLREAVARDGVRDQLNAAERAFVDASIGLEDSERAAAVRRDRRLRFLAASLALLLLVVTGVSVVALRLREEAVHAQQVSLSRQLAAEALGLLESRPAAAMLVSAEAFRVAPTFEARSALLTVSAHQQYRAELTGHGEAVSEAAFSRDGTLATVSRDRTVILWDSERRRRVATLRGHRTWLRAVAFSPDGRTLATGGDDGRLVLWDVAKRRITAALTGHEGQIKGIAFSPDGRTVASVGADRRVRLWDAEDRSRKLTLSGHTGTVWAVAFSPDGRTLATASSDRTARLWDARSGEPVATLTGHKASVEGVAFGPGGRTLATASNDGTARLWDVSRREDVESVATLSGHSGQVKAVAFSHDGRTLATGGADRSVMLWDASNGKRLTRLTGQTTEIYTLASGPRGSLLASAGEDGKVALWDTARIPLSSHEQRVNDVQFSPDGRTLATASGDHTVALWDPRRRTLRATLKGGAGFAHAVAFSPDSRTLATATGTTGRSEGNHVLSFWDAGGHGPPVRRTGHTGRVLDVAYSPDGRILATAGEDGRVGLWDAARRSRLATLTTSPEEAENAVNGVAFSPDGRTLATASQNGRAVLWDVAERRRRATLSGRSAHLRAVAFSPDGRTLATAGVDHAVTLWNVAERRPVGTLSGNSGPARAMAFSPDGRVLATATANKSVVLWDVDRRKPLAMLTGHTKQVRSVAFSPDGRTLASGGDDHSVKLWDVDPGRTSARFCAAVGRNLTPGEWRRFVPGEAYRETCPVA